jgi:class 3 adenylate cyclase
VQVCPGCGEGSPDRFRECPFCGHALAARHETHEERKILTVVFCDLSGSTALGERLDPESLGEVLDLYFTAMTRVLKRHGGSIQKFIGDAIVAAFGIPVVHEDDALRACRAATEMLQALDRLNRQLVNAYDVQLEVRIGVHTGEVVIRSASNDQQLLTGDTLNTAARLEQAALTNQILIGASTHRLVREAVDIEQVGAMALKGKAEPVLAYRLLRVFGDEQSSRRHDAPIVGRDEERARLRDAYARARDEGRCQLITVVGEAGVGKSRLVRALLDETAAAADALRGRCLPYGESITFWPIASIVREACTIDTDDEPDTVVEKLDRISHEPEVSRRVASALGWSDEELPMAELFWGIRELLERLADHRPLIVVIDDVHWAAPSLLELLEHLVETLASPILILCTARPDMLESLPAWSSGERRDRLVLDRLSDDLAVQIVDNLTDGVPLPADARAMVVRASEGNPLFVEQLVSMLVDSGVLVRENGRWVASGDLQRMTVPPSIDALLVARLDLLSPEERSVIEPASVVGLEFPSRAVRDLVPAGVGERMPAHLASLTSRQLIRPAPGGDHELDDHRFHHILIRDATYGRSLKRARADLHERFADWLERFDADHPTAGQHDEVIGYHLEQAWHYRRELKTPDVDLERLGLRAAKKLGAAGRRAFTRGDLPATITLLDRAAAVLATHHPFRLSLLPDLAEARMEAGAFDEAVATLRDTEDPEAREADEAEVARARLIRLLVDLYAGSDEDWAARVEQELERALPIFESAGHHVGQATAWRLRYAAHGSALDWAAAYRAAEMIIHHAEAAGDVRQQRRGALGFGMAALHGPTPVEQGIPRCETLVTAVEGDRRTQASLELCLGQLVAMADNVDVARQLCADARRMLVELGPSVLAASTSTDAASVELLAGELGRAEGLLREDLDALEEMGETYLRSTVGGLLARVLALQERGREAELLADEVRALAAPDDVDAQVLWRAATSRVRSQEGRHDEALLLADEAVALTGTATAPVLIGQSLADRAYVRLHAGDRDGATQDIERAAALYREKGNHAGLQSLRDLGDFGAG